MSTHHHYGDNVNMYGGTGNTGMIKNQGAATPASPELEAAVRELLALLGELRARIPAASARALDESLPALTADAAAPAQERHRALLAVAGIAATIGAVGQPVLEAVNRVLALIGP
ncbi:hypothetical protein ABZ490_21715 [Streptomyces sp. NPDC005811]|uniref:hypothetical protein n=1 Tax=Streptomyces sp. NPDC005811 TaxID=3154565 RepID=UPI0033D07171